MPLLDGYGFARALRAETGATDVLLVGTSADIDDGDAAVAAGMDRLLQKPLSAEAVADLLAPWGTAGNSAAAAPARLHPIASASKLNCARNAKLLCRSPACAASRLARSTLR